MRILLVFTCIVLVLEILWLNSSNGMSFIQNPCSHVQSVPMRTVYYVSNIPLTYRVCKLEKHSISVLASSPGPSLHEKRAWYSLTVHASVCTQNLSTLYITVKYSVNYPYIILSAYMAYSWTNPLQRGGLLRRQASYNVKTYLAECLSWVSRGRLWSANKFYW